MVLVPVPDGSGWLGCGWKQTARHQSFNLCEDHETPLLRHIWVNVVAESSGSCTQETQKKMYEETRKVKWEEAGENAGEDTEKEARTQEDAQKGLVWREMWRDAFRETK